MNINDVALTRVAFTITTKEAEALTREARELGLKRSELIRFHLRIRNTEAVKIRIKREQRRFGSGKR